MEKVKEKKKERKHWQLMKLINGTQANLTLTRPQPKLEWFTWSGLGPEMLGLEVVLVGWVLYTLELGLISNASQGPLLSALTISLVCDLIW